MITLDYKRVDEKIIGEDNGLNLELEFENYKDKIANIIVDLNKRKDKLGCYSTSSIFSENKKDSKCC